MERIVRICEKLISPVRKAGSLVIALAGLMLGGANLSAQCTGGSVVYDSTTKPYTAVGCLFPNWGTAEKAQCALSGLTVFNPANSGTCHLCVLPAYVPLVQSDTYMIRTDPFVTSHLTLDKAPISWIDGAHTPFRCLKCANPPAQTNVGGMTAWWSFDEWAAFPVQDASKHMSDGLRHGTTVVSGKSGNAVKFNGVNDYIEVPNAPLDANGASPVDIGRAYTAWPYQSDGNFSIDAWVKLDPLDNTGGVRVIAEKRTDNGGGSYTGYSFYLFNGSLGVQYADTLGFKNFGASLKVPQDGQWHLIAVSVWRYPSYVQFFLDGAVGVVQVTGPVPMGSLVNPAPVRIGMRTIDNGGAFNGSLDEVEIFNRYVNTNEFANIFAAQCYGKCK